MLVRNGLKTFAGNFILVWKHLVYLLITFALTATLFVLSLKPILVRLADSGCVHQSETNSRSVWRACDRLVLGAI